MIKDTVNLANVIDELVEERGLDRTTLSSIVCESMLAAYSKKYPDLQLKVDYDAQSGLMQVLVQKRIVSSVEDELVEISLKKARHLDKNLDLNEKVWLPFDGTIGRIEILRAKQIIATNIRKIEVKAIYDEFKNREGSVVHGVIHKCERGGAVVKLDDTLAFLPQSLTVPGEKCNVGFSIRALLKEVLPEPRSDYQLILDRSSSDFLKKLFELEIPEVYEKLVDIKRIVRIAGYKSKVAVSSNDKDIDPVGTFVGRGGGRIKPLLKELGGEKIDIISWGDSLESLIKNALKPAIINRVEVTNDKKSAQVWLDEDQRSLAIGRLGQNIALASRLTGVDIQLAQSSPNETDALRQAIEGLDSDGDAHESDEE